MPSWSRLIGKDGQLSTPLKLRVFVNSWPFLLRIVAKGGQNCAQSQSPVLTVTPTLRAAVRTKTHPHKHLRDTNMLHENSGQLELEKVGGAARSRERVWGVFRIVLGLGQIMGATMSLYLIIQMGIGALSLVAVLVTLSLTILSRLLFRD